MPLNLMSAFSCFNETYKLFLSKLTQTNLNYLSFFRWFNSPIVSAWVRLSKQPSSILLKKGGVLSCSISHHNQAIMNHNAGIPFSFHYACMINTAYPAVFCRSGFLAVSVSRWQPLHGTKNFFLPNLSH